MKQACDSASELRRGEGGEELVDLGLALALGEVERAAEAERLGDLLEEIVDRVDADRGQHLGPVLGRCGRVTTHGYRLTG